MTTKSKRRVAEINATLKRVHAKYPKARDAYIGPPWGIIEFLTASPAKQREMERYMEEAHAARAACNEEVAAELVLLDEKWKAEDEGN